ncbi:response regulator [Pararhodobacter sp. CCB-MM2]|uniref:response regulator n=1 Tax=Pararhodobacter sp. CCB-MM2 TaxID=1786003 RepID=UPI00082B6C5C|nr:response regulator [Pararhodobacter sp. CCB-MM2]
MRLVAVDDNQLILRVITSTLETLPDCEVVGAETAQAGIEACLEPTDVAIFDNRLPDMTGIEAVATLRARPETRHLPIIVITADGDRETRLSAIRAGATDFLQKPVSVDELRLRVRNLLELHRAQKDAAERQALMETLIDFSGSPIAVADAQKPRLPILHVSQSLLEQTGFDADQILGNPPCPLWNCGSETPEREALQRAVAARQPGSFVIPVVNVNGNQGWSEVTLTPVPEAGEQARHLVIARRDVTDIIEMREANERMANRLSDIARLSGAWFFELDAELRFSYVSDELALALGTTADQALTLPVSALPGRIAEKDGKGDTIDRLFAAPHHRVEHRMAHFQLRNGGTRAVQISAVPFHDAQGAFAGYRGHANDVSELARARDLAAQASKAKSVFLATMSHEMRTPLTALIGLTEELERDELKPGQRLFVSEIFKAARRLSTVVSDVLDVASMEQGKLEIHEAPFDPASVLSDALGDWQAAAASKGLSLDWGIDGLHREERLGDQERLRQIIAALTSNAIKFTEQGNASVRLDLSSAEGIVLTVSDTGIGLRPEEQAAAFTPFAQLDDGIARRFEGTGLGLSITRWLVEAMNGTITMQSAPGEGTLVRVSLPLAIGKADAVSAADLQGQRLLVADDNRSNRMILKTMLTRMGADVTLCEDGPEALERWQDGRYDALLLDINMPMMAGTDVIRTIRQQERLQGRSPVPAIAVTANARPDQVAVYRDVGFDDCVSKPFTGSVLAAALRARFDQAKTA